MDFFRTEPNTALTKDPEFTPWLEQRTPAGDGMRIGVGPETKT